MNTVIQNGQMVYPQLSQTTSGNIVKSMNALMKDLEAVGKTSKNVQQGFNFRGIDSMLNTFKPLFAKHNIVMTVDVIQYSNELKEVVRSSGKAGIDKHVSMLVKYTFHSAEDGSSVSSTVAAEGIDSGDKATTKALSMGLKYALIQTFTVPTEDIDDGDSDSPVISAPIAAAKPTTLAAKAVEATPQAEAPKAEAAAKPSFKRGNTIGAWGGK